MARMMSAGAALLTAGFAASGAAIAQDGSPYGTLPMPGLPAPSARAAASPEDAEASPAPGMGPLAAYLRDGEDPPWTYRDAPRGFTLSNTDDPSSIDYVYVEAEPGRDRTVTARVALEAGDGFAGLLLGFDQETRDYFLLTVGPDGVTVFRRDREGFRPFVERGGAVANGEAILRAEETGDRLRLFVDGEEVGDVETAGLGQGAVGIAAGGVVTATFTSFEVSAR